VYADNELLFPPYVIPTLRNLRGDQWRDLVDRVAALPQDHPDSLAFSLMMMRLDGCLTCETDSFRAMRGCTACAQQVLRRHKGSEAELLKRYQKALQDVKAYLASRPGGAEEIPLKAKAA
jgi:hypothetical protein